MKKSVIFVLILLALIVSVVLIFNFYGINGYTINGISKCSDSDNGNEPFIQGSVNYKPFFRIIIYEDKCINKNQLIEYYCDKDYIKIAVHKCQNGCENGKCKQQNIPSQEDDKRFKFNPFKINCPEDCKLIGGSYIPYITNTIPTTNISEFLSHSIIVYDTKHEDWWESSVMIEKINELTKEVNSNYKKAETIINWAHKSKNYCGDVFYNENKTSCISIMNHIPDKRDSKIYSYEEFFNYDYGVCLDAAYLATTMLRRAGIPAQYRVLPDNFHASVVFYIDKKWYATDPTFCFDKNNCENVSITEIGKERTAIFYYDDKANFPNENAKYCDMSNLCYDIKSGGTQKFIFVGEDLGEIFIPNSNILNGKNKQYGCSLKSEGFSCDSFGCHFEQVDSKKGISSEWRDIIGTSNTFYISDIPIDTFGYVYARIPLNKVYKYICQGIYDINPISISEITLKKNKITIISPDMLKKVQGANNKEFNEVKSLLSKGLEGVNINEIINSNKN